MSYNRVIAIGRLTSAPELKTTESGKYVSSFTVAVDRDKDHTDFLRCVAWENTAEFLSKYFAKGQEIGVEGSLQTRSYTDKNGSKREAVEIRAGRLFFVGGKVTTQSTESTKQSGYNSAPVDGFEEIDSDNDLPF